MTVKVMLQNPPSTSGRFVNCKFICSIFFCFRLRFRPLHVTDFDDRYTSHTPCPRRRNDEEIPAGTNAGPRVYQTVPRARHGRRPRRGHGCTGASVRDTSRPAVLSGTERVPSGPVRQGRLRKRDEACRCLPAVWRRSAHMHR